MIFLKFLAAIENQLRPSRTIRSQASEKCPDNDDERWFISDDGSEDE